ncbi:uncharacterized protein LOC112568390 [Pomacea canaliculata]|uniref:uncharacterized protein LOC112568390 n=1 Tax=Pomacea canaliculata TaxID=400727 RepID=UPI000D73D1DB|nr:uncharacterized protein LOC112568390 [Pomacea canaliculata]
MANITCETFTRRRYLYRCSLVVLNFPSQLGNGKYKIQVINEVGNENFTVAHAANDQRRNYAAVSGGVIAAVVVVIVAAVLIAIIRRRRYAKDDTSSDFSSSDTVAVPLSVRGLGHGWWTSSPPTPTPGSAVDKGRWTNQDGLTYVSLNFNNRKQNRAPKHEPTEYSTVKAIHTQIQS